MHTNQYIPFICARYASNIWSFSNQADVIFLSSGVARQHRKARGDNISLLLYGFSNIRYYKHNTSVVSLYKRLVQIIDIISFSYTQKENEISNKFHSHV